MIDFLVEILEVFVWQALGAYSLSVLLHLPFLPVLAGLYYVRFLITSFKDS